MPHTDIKVYHAESLMILQVLKFVDELQAAALEADELYSQASPALEAIPQVQRTFRDNQELAQQVMHPCTQLHTFPATAGRPYQHLPCQGAEG